MNDKKKQNPSNQNLCQCRLEGFGLSIVSLAPLRRAERIANIPRTPHPMIIAKAAPEMLMSANA